MIDDDVLKRRSRVKYAYLLADLSAQVDNPIRNIADFVQAFVEKTIVLCSENPHYKPWCRAANLRTRALEYAEEVLEQTIYKHYPSLIETARRQQQSET